jgi:hypothetical protein
MAKRALDERPEVKINANSTEYTDCVRIEIEILGADEAARNKVKEALLEAVKSMAGDEP